MHPVKHVRKNSVWTVVFLVDADPPQRLVMLKRAPWKSFAPGMYTGVGGKAAYGERPLSCAARELEEETGIAQIHLTEFARCVLDAGQYLHYYWGHYPGTDLPACTEGELVWVDNHDLSGIPIIPTTFEIIREWQRRNFDLGTQFTMFEKSIGKKDTYALVSVVQVLDGLI